MPRGNGEGPALVRNAAPIADGSADGEGTMGVQGAYKLLTELAERPFVGPAHPDYSTLTEQEGRETLLAAAEVIELVQTALGRTRDFMRHLLPPDADDRACEPCVAPRTTAMEISGMANYVAREDLRGVADNLRRDATISAADLEAEWLDYLSRKGKTEVYEHIQQREDELHAQLAALDEDRQRLGRVA